MLPLASEKGSGDRECIAKGLNSFGQNVISNVIAVIFPQLQSSPFLTFIPSVRNRHEYSFKRVIKPSSGVIICQNKVYICFFAGGKSKIVSQSLTRVIPE